MRPVEGEELFKKRVPAKPRAKAAARKSVGWRRANCSVVLKSW
jgi:hypothetical protein